ncbi:MAG: cyclic pyranopterin monophosphate synthase MoaC [Gemmatimonadota bacterium]|nr:cyclic pyranopterin monophosphate synthase MoaC [Gemmatimonadota bacterium]MDP6528656.1 cyclic pyranopterin monophosphate synthase MoaC [Gemmatimonadota bacterium]MDP6803059.1 cyclic pyranopterin monophosphate synthase MoaC [Gemmatimonadota bacterium]MDP7032018.1 cyclic pyranopterin monophosphate synthase MoaC [Gemmatimonadota bacterium]
MKELSHLDRQGRSRMVDVSEKEVSRRTAVAEGCLEASTETLHLVTTGSLPKGDFGPVVQLAGIAGAKRASELIPLCHPLPIDFVQVSVEPDPAEGRVRVTATVTATARTGIEMEALAAVSAGLLAAWDMLKAVDRDLRITGVRLLEKRGGRSGDWKANAG